MGGWSIYCFICGNTCYSFNKNYIDEIKEYIIEYNDLIKQDKLSLNDKKTIKFLKYYIDLSLIPNYMNNMKELIKNSKWMNKCTMLLSNNQIKHNCYLDSDNIEFTNSSNQRYSQMIYNSNSYPLNEKEYQGIFLHSDCWKHIKNKFNIELKFSDIPLTNHTINKKIIKDIDYGLIENYQEQDFNFLKIINDNNQYLCSSPLKGDKNIKQINKNINQLKIRYDKNRVSPNVSATFYKDGNIKIGNNNKFWYIENNRWNQLNEDIVSVKLNINYNKLKNLKRFKFLNNIPLIGLHNTLPVFIKSIIISKNNYIITLLTTSNLKNIIENMFN